MGTDLDVAFGHSLDTPQIAALPTLLNQYFSEHGDQIQVRTDHGYSGTLVDGKDDGWDWEASDDDDWELQTGRLEDEALWEWGWYPEQDRPFEQWFRDQQNYGYLHLVGPYRMLLFVGARAAVLATDIRWAHFVFDLIVQNDIRLFTRFLTGFFGGHLAIYMPDGIPPACYVADDCVAKGWGFNQILSWLYNQELPAASIKEMLETVYVGTTKCWSARGYYVDDFVGLPNC